MLDDITEEEHLVKCKALVFFKLTIRRLWSKHKHSEFKSLFRSWERDSIESPARLTVVSLANRVSLEETLRK